MFAKFLYLNNQLKRSMLSFNYIITIMHTLQYKWSYKYNKNKVVNYSVQDASLPRPIHSVTKFSNEVFLLSYGFIISIFNFFKNWVLSLLLGASLFVLLFTYKDVPFNKFLFTLVSLGFFSYLLLSGFIFFLKKYKYSKYTTAMHRFWRRSFSIFWLLEGYLFVIFLYLTVYSNQEPFFMYDNIQFFKDFTYPWRSFVKESVAFLFIITILSNTKVRIKDRYSVKTYVSLFIVTTILMYLTWLEFYQFFYTLSYYNSMDWSYDIDSNTWSLELENKRTRVLLHFITLCLIAKFWHFVFILGFWVFSLTRWLQSDGVYFPLMGANIQNFIILYLLNWILMYPWLKYVFRRFLYKNYTWYYSHFRFVGLRMFFNDITLYISYLII